MENLIVQGSRSMPGCEHLDSGRCSAQMIDRPRIEEILHLFHLMEIATCLSGWRSSIGLWVRQSLIRRCGTPCRSRTRNDLPKRGEDRAFEAWTTEDYFLRDLVPLDHAQRCRPRMAYSGCTFAFGYVDLEKWQIGTSPTDREIRHGMLCS